MTTKTTKPREPTRVKALAKALLRSPRRLSGEQNLLLGKAVVAREGPHVERESFSVKAGQGRDSSSSHLSSAKRSNIRCLFGSLRWGAGENINLTLCNM